MDGERRSGLPTGAAASLAGFVLLAVLLVNPPWSELGSELPGDLGDPLLNTYFLAWGAHWLESGATTDFWSANFFWPTPRPMLRSDHMLGPALVHFVLAKLFGVGPVVSYNLLFLGAFAVTGWTTCLVLRSAGLSWMGAFLGGLCFSFGPGRWDQASHLQVLLAPALAPALWWWHRFLATGRLQTGALFVLAYGVQILCGSYLSYFLHLALLAITLVHLRELGRELLSRRRIFELLAVGAVCAALALPIYAPYYLDGPQGLERLPTEVAPFGASVASFFRANPTMTRYPGLLTGSYRPENGLFPGVIALAFGLTAWLRRIRLRPRTGPRWTVSLLWLGFAISLVGVVIAEVYTLAPEAAPDAAHAGSAWFVGFAQDVNYRRPFRILIAGALLLGLGSRLATGSVWPLRWAAATPAWHRRLLPVAVIGLVVSFPILELALRELLPGLSGLRAISRASILTVLALSAFAGLGLDDLRDSLARRRGATIALLATVTILLVAGLELRPRIPWVGAPNLQDTATLASYLRDNDEVTALAEFPNSRQAHNQTLAMYRSTNHWKPIVNGYSGTIPALTQDLLSARWIPDNRTLDRLTTAGVTHVLVAERATGISQQRWRPVRDQFHERSTSLGLEHELSVDGFRVYQILGARPAPQENNSRP